MGGRSERAPPFFALTAFGFVLFQCPSGAKQPQAYKMRSFAQSPKNKVLPKGRGGYAPLAFLSFWQNGHFV